MRNWLQAISLLNKCSGLGWGVETVFEALKKFLYFSSLEALSILICYYNQLLQTHALSLLPVNTWVGALCHPQMWRFWLALVRCFPIITIISSWDLDHGLLRLTTQTWNLSRLCLLDSPSTRESFVLKSKEAWGSQASKGGLCLHSIPHPSSKVFYLTIVYLPVCCRGNTFKLTSLLSSFPFLNTSTLATPPSGSCLGGGIGRGQFWGTGSLTKNMLRERAETFSDFDNQNPISRQDIRFVSHDNGLEEGCSISLKNINK